MSQFNIRNLSPEIHLLIKMGAAEQKQSMSAFAATLLKEALEARELRSARLKLNRKLFRMPNQKPPQ